MSFQLPENAQLYDSIFEVNVTPELAMAWLKRNNFNRNINPATAYRYCNQMLAGRWKRTHQGIAFDKNGILIDGQHRLLAVCLSKKTVPMLVCVNETLDNHEVIDGGKARTNLDVLQLQQEDASLPGSVVTTLKAMVAGRYCNHLNISSAEVDDYYERFRDGIDFAVEMFAMLKVAGRLNDATIRGIIARAYYSVPMEKLSMFCEYYRTGMSHPLITPFRDWLFTLQNRRENTRREIYKRCQATLMAFLQGKETVEYPAQAKELFPLPKK